jgi:NADPH:quinone reductase-like Zn-dependent oxidoreductase
MKAMVRDAYGPPSLLRLEDVQKPVAGEGEVLVRVRAASANAGDWHLMRGTPLPFRFIEGLRTPRHRILGTDIAGNVEAVGSGVSQFRPRA